MINFKFLFIFVFSILFLSSEVKNVSYLRTLRIEETIKIILSNLNGVNLNQEFDFIYPKFSIKFKNFEILNRDPNNISIYQSEENENTFIINNISISFLVDIKVNYFKNTDFFKQQNCLDLLIPSMEIKYNLEDDTIKLFSINVSDNIIFDSPIIYLKYFNIFNKSCLYNENGYNLEYYIDNPKSKLIEKCKEMFQNSFERIQKDFNLLTYDVYHIFNKSLGIINISEAKNISYIKISKVILFFNSLYFRADLGKLEIKDLFIDGFFKSNDYDEEKEFSLSLEEDNYIIFHNKIIFPNSLFVYSNGTKMEVINELTNAFIKDYANYLNNIYKEYNENLDNVLN